MHELLPMAAGDYMDGSDETFRLFETQMYQPAADVYEVVNISSQEQPNPQGAAPVKSVKGKAAYCSMPAVKKLGNSADIESISVSTDTDDFVTPVTRSGKKVAAGKRKCGAKTQKDPAVMSDNVLSNQRAPKKSKRLTGPAESLRPPGQFRYLRNAKILREFMLSKHFRDKYKE
jgi:hypothetical protein